MLWKDMPLSMRNVKSWGLKPSIEVLISDPFLLVALTSYKKLKQRPDLNLNSTFSAIGIRSVGIIATVKYLNAIFRTVLSSDSEPDEASVDTKVPFP